MDMDQFVELVEDKGQEPSEGDIQSFEKEIDASLPDDYREFLQRCNGGYVGGSIWFGDPPVVGVHHVGGLCQDEDCSLRANHELYQVEEHWIPKDLLWIMDDPFGNATCIGIRGEHRGKVYFWDHESIPNGEVWDGRVETAGNVRLIAPSFVAFIDGCKEEE